MTARIGRLHTTRNRPRASWPRALLLHGHQHAAPGTQIGTFFSWNSATPVGTIGTESATGKRFSATPMFRCSATVSPAATLGVPHSPAQTSPAQLRIASENSPSASPRSEQNSKLSQSCNRNSSDAASASPPLNPLQPDTSPAASPVPSPCKLEHVPKLFQS